jgi:hypothetical protein
MPEPLGQPSSLYTICEMVLQHLIAILTAYQRFDESEEYYASEGQRPGLGG